MTDAMELMLIKVGMAAERGERCPTRDQLGGDSKNLTRLAREGWILIEVFLSNFRRITILKGNFAGFATEAPPLTHKGEKQKPYLVVNSTGTFCNGKEVQKPSKARPQPSAPRKYA